MKILTLCLLGLLPVAAAGQSVSVPPAVGKAAAPAARAAELATLEQFLALSDDTLAQMAAAIARVRAMTPAQREQMRKEIAAFRNLPAPQREQLRQGWGWMPPEIRDGWRAMMQHATPAEHAAIQAHLQALSPAEKADYRRKLVEEYLKKQPAK